MFRAGLILLHVGTHSAGLQQILTLTWRSVSLLMLEALNHIIIMSVFWVSIQSGLFHLNEQQWLLAKRQFLVLPEFQTSLWQVSFCVRSVCSSQQTGD